MYLHDKVHLIVSQGVNWVTEVESAVELLDLAIGYSAFGLFFLDPGFYKILRLFDCDLIGIEDGNRKAGYSVGYNGDSCSHLASPDNSKGFDTGKQSFAYAEHL